jgi:hypothetical protein
MADIDKSDRVSDDDLISALLIASRFGLSVDVQELLVHGDASRGVAPGILKKMIAAARIKD